MAAQLDEPTSFQLAVLTHLDNEAVLHSLLMQRSLLADGSLAIDESKLRSILEFIGKLLAADQPRWVASRRQLWLGSQMIKQFTRLAPYQSALLAALEAFGWPKRLDNPLPPPIAGVAAAKRRLRQTIDNLNRGMPAGAIRFRGDGSGLGVCWELCHTAKVTMGTRPRK